MNIDELVKKIEALEDENKANSRTIASMNKRIKPLEETLNKGQDDIHDAKRELERIGALVSRLGQFDSSLAQTKTDFTKKVSELESFINHLEGNREKTRQKDLTNIDHSIDRAKQDVSEGIEKRFKTFFEEDSRLVKKVEEISDKFYSNLKKEEDSRLQVLAAIEETRRNTKKLESLETNVETSIKRFDETRSRIEIVSDQLHKHDNQLVELTSSENERKKAQQTFLEQQTVGLFEHERTRKEWAQQFEQSMQKINALLIDFRSKQSELERSKEDFEEITQRFDRRVNELTETYRILEERLRQDWATFKIDEQKKLANYSLVYGEKQGDFIQQYEELKERMNSVEGENKTMQDVLVLVSSELQTGMQSLMKMVNNWIDTLEDIRGASKKHQAE